VVTREVGRDACAQPPLTAPGGLWQRIEPLPPELQRSFALLTGTLAAGTTA
jgi:hypothetical protein